MDYNEEKINQLLDIYGMDFDDACDEFILESVVPGICMNEGCDYVTEVEPDQTRGWCEECGTNTVVSFTMLVGFI